MAQESPARPVKPWIQVLLGSEDTGNPNTPNDPGNEAPRVSADSVYTVLEDLEITYAEGLGLDATSAAPFALPLKLDVYYPDADTTNRPVLMFIHGGFKGYKTKLEIIEMQASTAPRGDGSSPPSIIAPQRNYVIRGMPQCEDKLREMAQNGMDDLIAYYNGIVPKEWIEFVLAQGPPSIKTMQQGLAGTQLSEIRKLPFAGLWPTQIHMQSTLITSRWAVHLRAR